MIGYFANLRKPKLVLWCYLAWYVAMVSLYFDPSLRLWLSSLGIAGIIGFALNLATMQTGMKPDRWVVFRLYIFPFCVSSYSALIKDKGFVLLFPCNAIHIAVGLSACLCILLFHAFCKILPGRKTAELPVEYRRSDAA